MQIFVRTYTDRLLTIIIDRFDSIAVLKYKIEQKIHLPPVQQILIFNGKLLDDERVLADYSI
jgi:hypothetical protein